MIFLGLIIAFGGTTKIWLHVCTLQIPLIILCIYIHCSFLQNFQKTFIFVSCCFKACLPSSPVCCDWSTRKVKLKRKQGVPHTDWGAISVGTNTPPGSAWKPWSRRTPHHAVLAAAWAAGRLMQLMSHSFDVPPARPGCSWVMRLRWWRIEGVIYTSILQRRGKINGMKRGEKKSQQHFLVGDLSTG